MITASTFAHKHNSFWKTNFPALESYIRVVNSGAYDRILPDQAWKVVPERSFLISEVGFCLSRQTEVDKAIVDRTFDEAVRRLSGLPGAPDAIDVMDQAEIRQSISLSKRIRQMIPEIEMEDELCIFDPIFSGCGVISKSQGDLIAGETLIEIKSVDRNFRASDFRQLLIYYFQNSAGKTHSIRRLKVLNPRRGISFSAKAPQLIFDISGSDVVEAQGRFLSAVSMGGISR